MSVAETFARALTAYDPARSLLVKSFLFTFARRLVLDHARHHARLNELTDIHPDAHSDLAINAEIHDELQAIASFLEQFPEINRTALLMRAHGLSYSEIAQALDISQAAAKVKVHRLRLKLAEWRIARDDEHNT